MHLLKRIVCLCAVVTLSACGGQETPAGLGEAEHLESQSNAATSAALSGCLFAITSNQRTGTLPPIYDIYLRRSPLGSCAYPLSSVLLGSSYNTPYLSLVANSLGVAVAYTTKSSPSGSAVISCTVQQFTPDTLTSVRTAVMGVSMGGGNVTSCLLAIDANGTTVTATGDKTGPLPGQTGSPTGTHYVATYLDFFTTTTAPTYFSF